MAWVTAMLYVISGSAGLMLKGLWFNLWLTPAVLLDVGVVVVARPGGLAGFAVSTQGGEP